MNKQEKFTIWSLKFKVHRSNSQTTLLYPVRFSTNTAHNNNIFLIFFFGFCCFFLSFSLFFLRNKIWNIYIPVHTWLCSWINDKNIFTRLISGNKTTFFGLSIVLFSRFNHHKTVISTTNTWFLQWT